MASTSFGRSSGFPPSTVSKWARRRRETGSVPPGKFGGHRRRLPAPHRETVHALVSEMPHRSVRVLRSELVVLGIAVSEETLRSFLHAERLSFKKVPSRLSKTGRTWPDGAADGQAHQASIDPKRQVFIDEIWAKTNMAPLRGWGRRGQKLIGKALHGRWHTLTFLAALRADRIDAPSLFNGPINGQKFLAYVEQLLVTTLGSGDIVIMDNLGSHKSKAG